MGEVGRFRRGGRPFDFAGGVPRPGRYPADSLDVAGAIEAIRFAPVEIGYGFDVDGRQLFRYVGDQDEIRGFSETDLSALADGTFVHSHPPYAQFPRGDPRRRAGSLSPRDLSFMYECDLAEMVAVMVERTYHVRRHLDGVFLDPGQLSALYEEFAEVASDALRDRWIGGIISLEEATAEGRIADEVMERFRPFFDYWWEEVSDDAG